MDSVQPKSLLIDEDDQVLGVCLDAEGIFVEPTESDEDLTVEILGCLHAQRLRDYLEGSKRYRQRNPLDSLWLRMLDAAGEPLMDFWAGEILEWRPPRLDPERVDIVAVWDSTVRWPVHGTSGSAGVRLDLTSPTSGRRTGWKTGRNG